MVSFKNKLKNQTPLVGTLITMNQPIVSEILSLCGFDWLWIDMEHSPLSLEQVQLLIQAKSDHCPALVRVPTNDTTWIKRVLDIGVDGIIVPQINSAEDARRAIEASKYPPLGHRSVGLARAHQYGKNFSSYVQNANESIAMVLQIEHEEGVANIDSILSVPGIDAIILGPYDLSGSLNKLGQIHDIEIQESLQIVQKKCKDFNMPLGIFALELEEAQNYLKLGYQCVVLGMDVHFLWSSAAKNLALLKNS